MKIVLTAIALMIAAPAIAQTSATSHAGHQAAPAGTDAGKARSAKVPAGCHLMNGKLMATKDGKMVPCPEKDAKRPPATGPHAGHGSKH